MQMVYWMLNFYKANSSTHHKDHSDFHYVLNSLNMRSISFSLDVTLLGLYFPALF